MSGNEIPINYNSYDFFYVRVGSKMPTDDDCNNPLKGYKLLPESECVHFPSLSAVFLNAINECSNSDPNNIQGCLQRLDDKNINKTHYAKDYPIWEKWQRNSYKCYKKELCLNKDNANQIKEMQEDHLGSEQNFLNSKDSYNNELWKTGNLSIGILSLMIIMYYIY